MKIQKLFPTYFFSDSMNKASFSKLGPQLLRDCYLFQELDREGQKWSKSSYSQGYTSYSSITDLHRRSSAFQELKGWMDQRVKVFARSLEYDLQGKKLEISSFWINIMGEHCSHSYHLHPLSAISGTFYLQTPKGSGSFKIEDPRLPAFMASPPPNPKASRDHQRFISIEPRAGDLVLFESWLKHEVTANRAKRDRVSVSFNYDWV